MLLPDGQLSVREEVSLSPRRIPRTSYGYLAPAGARVVGWECRRDGCGTGGDEVPRSWPFPCRECRRPADAVFDEPWEHDAEFFRIRDDLRRADSYRRTVAELKQHVWAYKDARFRGDDAAASTAWRDFRRTRQELRQRGDGWFVPTAAFLIVELAASFDDLDGVAAELLAWHPLVDTRDLEENNERRTDARTFVSACILMLEREASIGHPQETAVSTAMRDIARRSEEVLVKHHHDGFRRIGEVRALHAASAAIAASRTWVLPRLDVEDPVCTVAATALTDLEVHDDTSGLDTLVDRLQRDGTAPCLLHLLRARRAVAAGRLQSAIDELDLASGSAARTTDPLATRLLPLIHATRGTVLVLHDQRALDDGIIACRTGRRVGLRPWRRVTAADTGLAQLLLWRAQQPGNPPGRGLADVQEAARLARRRCRPWHRPGADDSMVLQEALTARSGGRSMEQHRESWRRTAGIPWSAPERARVATAWVGWAVGTGVAEAAAEAYQYLMSLVPLDAAARYGPSAKQRVLAAAQEHTEEAGYWLARTRQFRAAAVALETGRAVLLSEVLGQDDVAERLRAAGRADLAEEYRRALAGRPAGPELRAMARRVTEVIGTNPLALNVTYGDITAAAEDGALVYIAAAKAGGYALIVAATHDPQFVELPKLDRASVAALLGPLLPGPGPLNGRAVPRDLGPVLPRTDPMAPALRTLWDHAMKDLVLASARGRIVTLVPVGLLSLLPLHAAGEPGAPGDTYMEWRHAGHFSSIRYAPNARSLRHCRETARELGTASQRLLAVDVPDAAGGGARLHHVHRETIEIMHRWTGAGTTSHACTWAEFRDAADEHSVWHLACHGSAEPTSIVDSRLCFADQDITLHHLSRALRRGPRRLAVLSACETNLTGDTVPNEVVGMPSVLLQVGFAGVIASSWKVDDLATVYLMTAFYQYWCRAAQEPAVALNLAQQWLRNATHADLATLLPGVTPGGEGGTRPYVAPQFWAAFAYTGA